MSDITIALSDGPEVSDAGRDCQFVSSASGTVHKRDESEGDDHDYEFYPTCGQRLPDGSNWGRVEANSAEEIAEKRPYLSFCTKCFTNSLRLNQIRRKNR